MLAGQDITREWLMDMTATTYSYATVTEMTGATIKTVLEDVADNLFNPDPYYQQGGDMVRVGGLQYAIDPAGAAGARISDMRLGDAPIQADKQYKVAGWAPVAEGAQGEPVWDVVATYLRDRKTIAQVRPNQPMVKGVAGNQGLM
ncbi:bifunctional 2',3'-cyclic nucleotide 2'-phosphodiesterase/3'-nucleotidase precursor protein [compost metagenome]